MHNHTTHRVPGTSTQVFRSNQQSIQSGSSAAHMSLGVFHCQQQCIWGQDAAPLSDL